MGYLSVDQLFLGFGIVAAIDMLGIISFWRAKAWLLVVVAVALIPFDFMFLQHVDKHVQTSAHDYTIRA